MISTELWLDNLFKEDFMVYKSPSFTASYTLAFFSPYHLSLLRRCKEFCLDATHGATNIDKGILYTIVVRHPDSEASFPLVYCFTNDHSTTPLVEFFTFLSVLGMMPNKITIDISKTELAAIEMVLPAVNVQWCLFHVGRAWIYSEFLLFIEYFKRNYINNDWYKHWCKAFQLQYDTNIETNNYVESWHNQLKIIYLKRKPNIRLDRLIHIMVNDVEPEFISSINRVLLGIGRMGNREREEVKRRNLAEDIPNERVEEYVDKELSDDGELSTLLVKVFDDSSDNIYIIAVIDKIVNCKCYYFNFYQKSCKHMYLSHRLYEDVKVYQMPTQQLTFSQQNIEVTTHTIPETSQPDSDSLQKQQNSTVVNDIKNLINHFSTIKSQESFDEKEWEALYTLRKRLTMLKSKNDEVSLPSNSNLNTQRR